MPVIMCPSIARPDHHVDTETLIAHYADRYKGHPRLDDALRVMSATRVDSRAFATPLAELDRADHGLDDRTHEHFERACQLAEAAARQALSAAGMEPADIGTLVCVSTTGYAMPGLDVALMDRLRLPANTTRIPVTQMGCNGGSWALARAAERCTTPHHVALVVAADLFLTWIHPDDTGMDAMIYRALMGDAAGACLVTGDDSTPGARIHTSWDYTVPGTSTIVSSHLHSDGLHLRNSPRLQDAVSAATREMAIWLKQELADRDAVDFLVSHPGGPRIMERLADGLGCDPALLRHSWNSLREIGNAGSVSILDVLARTYADPPRRGTQGLAIGVGPGVTVTASRLTWQ